MIVTLPLGALLPPGAGFLVEGGEPIKLQFLACGREGCTTVGQPIVASIAVEPALLDALAPPAPLHLTALGSYGRIVVAWEPIQVPDLAGYLVERSPSSDGPFSPIGDSPLVTSRLLDDAVSEGKRV